MWIKLTRRAGRLGVLATVAVALCASVAQAASMLVEPGVGTLQAAIDGNPGVTTFVLKGGCYEGPVAINRPGVHVVAKPSTFAIIDGGCSVPTTVQVTADKVMLKGVAPRGLPSTSNLMVTGATDADIAIGPSLGTRLKAVHVGSPAGWLCPTGSCVATDGIRLTAGSRAKLIKVSSEGAETGLHVTNVAAGAGLVVNGGNYEATATGVLVEHSGAGSILGRSGIRLMKFHATVPFHACPDAGQIGVSLVDASGLLLKELLVLGETGLTFDATSTNNLVVASGTSSACTPVIDNGTGNCGSGLAACL